jgi:hypothetical protein
MSGRRASGLGCRWVLALFACWGLTGLASAAETPLAVLAPAAPALAQPALLAGPPGSGLTLEDALRQAKDGDTIDLLPGEYRTPLLIDNRRLTLRGLPGGQPAVINGEGKLGTAKALWTVRGGQVTLQNLEFRGARSGDGAGAGVRFEGGGVLRVVRCTFFDNEHGLMAANEDKAELHIEASVFGMAPRVEGGLHHLLNVGRIARLSITGSRFQQGFEGHLIKTRARENHIAYNFIHDGSRGGASYEIDIANGGIATVIGNVIGQGADSQNLVMVAYASEDRPWDQNRLVVSHNTFINHGWVPAWYLRVFGKNLPGPVEVLGVNNLLVGGGVFGLGADGRFEGNRHVTRGMLRDFDTYAFELPPGGLWRGSGVDPRALVLGGKRQDLSPKAEFQWPTGTRPLTPVESWSPGAFQK